MASSGVGNTALGAAICRLIEQSQSDPLRLFNDRVVADLVGRGVRSAMKLGPARRLFQFAMDSLTPGIYGAQICRTRYIDDIVIREISGGVGQVLILGAGYDSRAYRLADSKVRFFEIDLASVQERKRIKLQSGKWLTNDVSFVPIDFESQRIESVLADTRFDPRAPSLVIWEGVTQYMTESAVCRTFEFLGELAKGSVVIFTYVLKSVIEGRSSIRGADRLMNVFSKDSAPWLFGIEPNEVAAFLSNFRLTLREDVGHADYDRTYLRPIGRSDVVSKIERVAVACAVGA